MKLYTPSWEYFGHHWKKNESRYRTPHLARGAITTPYVLCWSLEHGCARFSIQPTRYETLLTKWCHKMLTSSLHPCVGRVQVWTCDPRVRPLVQLSCGSPLASSGGWVHSRPEWLALVAALDQTVRTSRPEWTPIGGESFGYAWHDGRATSFVTPFGRNCWNMWWNACMMEWYGMHNQIISKLLINSCYASPAQGGLMMSWNPPYIFRIDSYWVGLDEPKAAFVCAPKPSCVSAEFFWCHILRMNLHRISLFRSIARHRSHPRNTWPSMAWQNSSDGMTTCPGIPLVGPSDAGPARSGAFAERGHGAAECSEFACSDIQAAALQWHMLALPFSG